MKTVFLDLDGTLVDPKPGITGSVQSTLERLGLTVPSADDLEWVIGPPLLASFKKLGAPNPQDALDMYREFYGAGGMFEASLYPGIVQALQHMTNEGLTLCLATGKSIGFAREVTHRFDLSRFFAHQFGSELDGTRSDKADLLAHAMTITGAKPGNSLMIGDRGLDIEAARTNHMASVWCSWGYGPNEGEAATARANTPAEMAELAVDMLA
ncbi:MAG: HAD hydrolase-like protein [Deltaproteobacteria bacterium]